MTPRTERLVTIFAFLGAGVTLAVLGFDSLACVAIGAAAGYAPARAPRGTAAAVAIVGGFGAAFLTHGV